MQKISESTSAATPAGEFTEGNPVGAVPATPIKAAWLNALQRELVAVIEGAGLTLNREDDGQLFVAVQRLVADANTWASITAKPSTLAGFGINDAFSKTETSTTIQAAIAAHFATTVTNALALKAPLASPVLSGVPTAPTAALGTNTTQLATTAYVANSIKQIQSVSAAVAANALTFTLAATSLDFRSSSISTGTVNTRAVPTLSLVIPQGATLGTTNATSARIAVLAIDSGGTVELAACNLAGGLNLDETTLLSTTAISATATAKNIVYSTTARTGVPFRVVGFADLTQTTAGTWAATPSIVQGVGGQALTALSSLGYGQTYIDVTASRVSGTTYTNTTGRPILVQVQTGYAINQALTFVVDGVTVFTQSLTLGGGTTAVLNHVVLVKPGAEYTVSATAGFAWKESR
ncbi:hypothetical protein [Pseudomonas sp. GV071]|uniref:hypothetical protein n=1 Tax=Pseudomonas sp. GV071 TaxID=2135754 RepID=UPI000D39AD80|nr:hypothetical protein [Pseudomonas sp. GV071]PTQ70082.1 hypothetical protein C8K61_107298 [Pseudomonas sp. GV071]